MWSVEGIRAGQTRGGERPADEELEWREEDPGVVSRDGGAREGREGRGEMVEDLKWPGSRRSSRGGGEE